MRPLVGVFAKQPVAGAVKTRLARATSPEYAQRIARAFLADTLQRIRLVDAARALVFSPAAGIDFFETVAHGEFSLIPQRDGDLGQRLHGFFETARQQGYARTVALGTDSPTLPVEYIERALDLLVRHDAVVGPAVDGGYYLIGARAECRLPFDEIPWSTSRVLEATVHRLRLAGVRFALLPPWYDVDTVDDWAFLCGHVQAIRLAGFDPGVPHTESLITANPMGPTSENS